MTPVLTLDATDLKTCHQLEVRLQTLLEYSFRILRERVGAALEMRGRLPVTFWMLAHDFLVEHCTPVFEHTVLAGIEDANPLHLLRGEHINRGPHLGEMARQFVRDLAGEITVAAGTYVDDLMADGAAWGEVVAGLVQEGPLSDNEAYQLALTETQRLLAAGRILASPNQTKVPLASQRMLS
ncbi:MAG: hypothetical protein K8I60_13815 [Anaerolineae bacterium]|nr:hypothetical protein [Anaerolineae bacterium]